MSRLDIMTPSRSQTVIDGLYRDVERRIASSPPGLCPVDLALSFLRLCHAQTCGKCVPCRIGLGQLATLLEQVLNGEATMETLSIIERTARVIYNSADCAIGRDAARLVSDGLAGFRDDEEVYNAMLMAYAQRRDVSDAMAARTRLLDTREIAAKARQERAVEKAVQKPVSIQEAPVKEANDTIINTDTLPNKEQLYTLGFEIRHVTRTDIAALNDFLKVNGIAFKKTYSTREEE